MFDIPIDSMNGTEISDVTLHYDNLGDNKDFEKFFHKGYWKISLSSDGKCPPFPRGAWELILLAPLSKDVDITLKPPFVPVYIPSRSLVAKVVTTIDIFEEEGHYIAVPAVHIDVASKEGLNTVKIQFGEVEVIVPPELRAKFH